MIHSETFVSNNQLVHSTHCRQFYQCRLNKNLNLTSSRFIIFGIFAWFKPLRSLAYKEFASKFYTWLNVFQVKVATEDGYEHIFIALPTFDSRSKCYLISLIIKSALRILSYKFQISFTFILIHQLTKAQYKKPRLETSTWLYKLWSVRAKGLTRQTRQIYTHTITESTTTSTYKIYNRYVVTPYIFRQYLGRRQVRLSESLGTKDSSVLLNSRRQITVTACITVCQWGGTSILRKTGRPAIGV